MSNSGHSKRVTNREEVSEFLKKIRSGEIKPSSWKHDKKDKDNYPLSIFSFPHPYNNWEIHVHWKDEKREEPGRTHIKDLKTGEYIPEKGLRYKYAFVDDKDLAMLRHHSDLDEEDTYEKWKRYFSEVEEEDTKAVKNKEIEKKEEEKKRLEKEEEKHKRERIITGIYLLGMWILWSILINIYEDNPVPFIWGAIPVLVIAFAPAISKHQKTMKKLKKVEKELSDLRK